MDWEAFLKLAPWVASMVFGAMGLYVGRELAMLRVDILKDAEERERRLQAAIKELGDHFQARLDAGASR